MGAAVISSLLSTRQMAKALANEFRRDGYSQQEFEGSGNVIHSLSNSVSLDRVQSCLSSPV
jgi:hypothetical protein